MAAPISSSPVSRKTAPITPTAHKYSSGLPAIAYDTVDDLLAQIGAARRQVSELEAALAFRAMASEDQLSALRPLLAEQIGCASRLHDEVRNLVSLVDPDAAAALSDSVFVWKEADVEESIRLSLQGTRMALDIASMALHKVGEWRDRGNNKASELQNRVEPLLREKEHIGVLLRSEETSRPAPTLPDELIQEIFLRLQPDEPAWLVRASLASKLWLDLLSAPAFRDHYLELHGAPPILGYLYVVTRPYPERLYFAHTTKFRPRIPDGGWRRDCYYEAQHCRHGRVLLATDDYVVPVRSHRARIALGTAEDYYPETYILWNPMTGYQREFDKPDFPRYMIHHAAVLCAVSGCDHRTCHEGPFRVVFFGVDGDTDDYNACVRVFSSETGQWSEPCPSLHLEDEPWYASGPRQVLVEDAVYFKFGIGKDLAILKYDMGSECLSLIDVPVAGLGHNSEAILMAMEDGSLGFALMDELSLCVWSRQMDSWTKRRTIDLETLTHMRDLKLKGHVEGTDIVLMTTYRHVYEFDVKSLRLKKLCNRRKNSTYLIPYTSFYHPQGNLKKEDASKVLDAGSDRTARNTRRECSSSFLDSTLSEATT